MELSMYCAWTSLTSCVSSLSIFVNLVCLPSALRAKTRVQLRPRLHKRISPKQNPQRILFIMGNTVAKETPADFDLFSPMVNQRFRYPYTQRNVL